MKQLKLEIALFEKRVQEQHHTSEASIATQLDFSLTNSSAEPISIDKLATTFIYPIDQSSFVNAKVLTHSGTYLEFGGQSAQPILLQSGQSWKFSGNASAVLNQYSDMPAGFFALSGDKVIDVEYTKEDKLATSISKVEISAAVEEVAAVATKNIDTGVESRAINCFPLPKSIVMGQGTADLTVGFVLKAHSQLQSQFFCMQEIESQLACADKLFVLAEKGLTLDIQLDAVLETEAYQLNISAAGILIKASDRAGVHNALVSLWQIASLNVHSVACMQIDDGPRFEWRGQHLDTARVFYTVAEIKTFINHMSLYKLNKFHWHLVDDEAWRMQVNAYPQLCEKISSRGHGQLVEPQYGSGAQASGGFYSQQQMREIVDYAAQRNIEVIPEIDIPGHCYALLKLFPELSEAEDQSDYQSVQGYRNNCLNPALPATYQFLERVFKEVAEIFPSQYVHIGADERPEGSWQKSPKIAALMAEQGFSSTEQVQSYFLNKVQQMLARLGKKTAAWEEATEQGELAKDGYIVSWKGTVAGINALKRGYQVVMAPAQHCYFDVAQSRHWDEPGLTWTGGRVGLQQVYDYNPLGEEISANLVANLKGIQGCLWSENLYDKSIVEHQLFPRIIALAEICWSEPSRQNFSSFQADLKNYHQPLLDALQINYRRRDFA